jgi:hypothetical protein
MVTSISCERCGSALLAQKRVRALDRGHDSLRDAKAELDQSDAKAEGQKAGSGGASAGADRRNLVHLKFVGKKPLKIKGIGKILATDPP